MSTIIANFEQSLQKNWMETNMEILNHSTFHFLMQKL